MTILWTVLNVIMLSLVKKLSNSQTLTISKRFILTLRSFNIYWTSSMIFFVNVALPKPNPRKVESANRLCCCHLALKSAIKNPYYKKKKQLMLLYSNRPADPWRHALIWSAAAIVLCPAVCVRIMHVLRKTRDFKTPATPYIEQESHLTL